MRKVLVGICFAIVLFIAYSCTSSIAFFVTFDVDGQQTVVKIADGDLLQEPESPNKPNHTFIGWFTEDAIEFDFENTAITGNLTLYAKFTPIVLPSYYVSFNTDGGTEIPSQLVTQGSRAIEPENPTKEYMSFVGWFTLANVPFNFSTPITSALVLVAHYEHIMVTITVDLNDGSEPYVFEMNAGERLASFEPANREGFKFIHFLLNGEPFDFNQIITGNIELVATWEAVAYVYYNGVGIIQLNEKLAFRFFDVENNETWVEGFSYNGLLYRAEMPEGSVGVIIYRIDKSKPEINLVSYTGWGKTSLGNLTQYNMWTFGGSASGDNLNGTWSVFSPADEVYVYFDGTGMTTGGEHVVYYFYSTKSSYNTWVVSTPLGNNLYQTKVPIGCDVYKITRFSLDETTFNWVTYSGWGSTNELIVSELDLFVFDSISVERMSGHYTVYGNEEAVIVIYTLLSGVRYGYEILAVGDKATEPTPPTQLGYDFIGWNLLGAQFDFNTELSGSIILVAHFEATVELTYVYFEAGPHFSGGETIAFYFYNSGTSFNAWVLGEHVSGTLFKAAIPDGANVVKALRLQSPALNWDSYTGWGQTTVGNAVDGATFTAIAGASGDTLNGSWVY